MLTSGAGLSVISPNLAHAKMDLYFEHSAVQNSHRARRFSM